MGEIEVRRALRAVRRGAQAPEIVIISAADPLNLVGILTPDERIAPQERRNIQVG